MSAIRGSCLCGGVKFEITGPLSSPLNCHCSICRRTTGAPFVAWFSSSEKGTRSFCARCGTQLTFEHANFGDEIDVTTCSLDDPELVPPWDNTRTSSRLRWIVPDGLPEYPESRQ